MSKNYNDIKVKKVSGASSGKSDARSELAKLENLFNGPSLVGYCLVKCDEVKAQIQKISANLPGELEQAKSIIKQSEITIAQAENQAEAIVSQAEREKNNILQDAQMRADNLVSEDSITERARFEAATLINQANVNISDAQTELNNYSLDVLGSLRELIENYLASINTTIDNIQGTIESRGEIEASYPDGSSGNSFPEISGGEQAQYEAEDEAADDEDDYDEEED